MKNCNTCDNRSTWKGLGTHKSLVYHKPGELVQVELCQTQCEPTVSDYLMPPTWCHGHVDDGRSHGKKTDRPIRTTTRQSLEMASLLDKVW